MNKRGLLEAFIDENWKKVDVDTEKGPVTIRCSVCKHDHCYICVAGDLMTTPDGKYEMAGMCRYMSCDDVEFTITFE